MGGCGGSDQEAEGLGGGTDTSEVGWAGGLWGRHLDQRDGGVIYCMELAAFCLVGVIYEPALLVVPFKR